MLSILYIYGTITILTTSGQEPEFRQYDIDSLGKDFTQAYKLADELLQDPYKRLLNSLEKINENLNEGTEE